MYEVLADIARDAGRRAARHREQPRCRRRTACWLRELDYWEGVIDAQRSSSRSRSPRAGIRWLRRNPAAAAQRGCRSVPRRLPDRQLPSTAASSIDGILDWEMAHFGDPLEDIAWSFMPAWQWARDGRAGGIADRTRRCASGRQRSGLRVDRDRAALVGRCSAA